MFPFKALVVLLEESRAIVDVVMFSQVDNKMDKDRPQQADELWTIDFQAVIDKVQKKGYY
jgi:hypothetical protein